MLTIGESKFDEPNESFYKGILDASRDGACERTLQKVKSATVDHITRYLLLALLRKLQMDLKPFPLFISMLWIHLFKHDHRYSA